MHILKAVALGLFVLSLVGCPNTQKDTEEWTAPTPDLVCRSEWRIPKADVCFTCPDGYERKLKTHAPDWDAGKAICSVEGRKQCITVCTPGEGWGTCDSSKEWKTLWCQR